MAQQALDFGTSKLSTTNAAVRRALDWIYLTNAEREGSRDDYADPVQVFVEYASVLDLVFDAQSEEGLWEQEA